MRVVDPLSRKVCNVRQETNLSTQGKNEMEFYLPVRSQMPWPDPVSFIS